MATREALETLKQIEALRLHGLAQGWPVPRIAEAIVDQFGVSLPKAYRLAHDWSRPEAIERILATYTADSLRAPRLTTQRLCEWEHHPDIRPGEDYLDRLCRVYQTRRDLLGYGRDYTPAEHLPDVYAGMPRAATGEEADANRKQFLRGGAVTGLAVLLDQAGRAAVRLSGKLGASNLGAVTVKQLELRVAGFMQDFGFRPLDQLFSPILAQYEAVESLLDGPQSLSQRRQLYRIAGQLSVMLGAIAFDLGDYPTAYAHQLTAWQLARQIEDHDLTAFVRMEQSTAALWAGDYRAALDYAQDGQRYATGARSAQLAVRCEARAYARLGDRPNALDALQRAERAMPSQRVIVDPGAGWWAFSSAASQLYTGITLLWLDDPQQAQEHSQQAITAYATQPPALQYPANQAQARITMATCLVDQGQPEEGIRLATETVGVGLESMRANLLQAHEFLAALPLRHRNLPAALDFADHVHTLEPSTHA